MASRRRLGDESGENEETAIDLRFSPKKPIPAPPVSAERHVPRPLPSEAAPKEALAKARPPAKNQRTSIIVDDESDEDATEFLSVRPRPQRSPILASAPSSPPARSAAPAALEPSLRAHGRAVPLDGEPMVPSGSEPRGGGPNSSPRNVRDSTEPFIELDGLPRLPRPLPSRQSGHDGSATASHAGSASVPRVTRIQIASTTRSEPPAIGPEDPAEPTVSADHSQKRSGAAQDVTHDRPAPDARIRRTSTAVQALGDETQAPEGDAPASSTGEILADQGESVTREGVLVVEAPNDASVIVNGIDRGRGVVRVAGLDRHARHAVRIHRPGHLPWSASVTLEGKPAAKIRPTLKVRPR